MKPRDGTFYSDDLKRLQNAFDLAWHEVQGEVEDQNGVSDLLSAIVGSLGRRHLNLDVSELKTIAVRMLAEQQHIANKKDQD